MDETKITALKDVATQLRIDSVEATSTAGSGHPTSCASMAEIASVLFFHTMRYNGISKGHAAPILYAAWAEAGLFPRSKLTSLRTLSSDLEGHPTPRLKFVDVATGSLGQGLGASCGMAWTAKYCDKADYRVYCVMGDGECSEGSVWEAVNFASIYKLDNLCAVVDVNRLGQSGPTPLAHDMCIYKRRFEAFGWEAFIVNGHNVSELAEAFDKATRVKGKPAVLLAETLKGKGLPQVSDKLNWHGKPMGDLTASALNQLKSQETHSCVPTPPLPQMHLENAPSVAAKPITLSEPPSYKKGDMVATRAAYGTAVTKLGRSDARIIALDADVKNSTFSEKFRDEFPDRFIECFIAEQNMVSVAVGCASRNSTFACFLTRAFDQIRMAAISQSTVNFCGSHSGVSIGEDGPSQMGLEDLAMFRAVPNALVLYPSDATSCERAVALAANYPAMTYIRASRPSWPVLYGADEQFAVGKAKVLRQSPSDCVTVVAAGVTLHEALKAADALEKDNIRIRVIDLFCVKPIDKDTLLEAVRATHGLILTVEDHYPEGGIGEAVASALSSQANVSLRSLAVRSIPRSGKPDQLLSMFMIDCQHIVDEVRLFLK